MKLRIVSDGTARGTELRTEDGKRIAGVQSISWKARSGRGHARCTIVVKDVLVDAAVEVYQTAPEEPEA